MEAGIGAPMELGYRFKNENSQRLTLYKLNSALVCQPSDLDGEMWTIRCGWRNVDRPSNNHIALCTNCEIKSL